MPPKRSTHWTTTWLICSTSVTSQATGSTSPPKPSTSAFSSSSFSTRRAQAQIFAPFSASTLASPRPTPELAPVTMATRPSSFFMFDSHRLN